MKYYKAENLKIGMPLLPFDSVKAARDPLVQKELLKMALADGDLVALAHALAVIEKAKNSRSLA